MIMVDLEFPALGKIYQFCLDEHMTTELTINEVTEIICQKEHCSFQGDRSELMLCSKTNECFLNKRMTLIDHGVKTADCLILL